MTNVFKPRDLQECEEALGDVEDTGLQAAFDPGIREGITRADGGFKLLDRPRSGDWLHRSTLGFFSPEFRQAELRGQSYPQYENRMITRPLPTPDCKVLLICPLGFSFNSEIGRMFMPYLVEYCEAFFSGVIVEVHEELPLDAISQEGGQYCVEDIFTLLKTNPGIISKSRVYCRLGVTLKDINHDNGYVYGLARANDRVPGSDVAHRVAVCSFARHRPRFSDGVHAAEAVRTLNASDRLEWLRTFRHTMIHETCHMFGLLHCVHWQCLMNGYQAHQNGYTQNKFLCPVCLRKLMYAFIDVCGQGTPWPSVQAIDDRYAKMEAVLQELADEEEQTVWEASGLLVELRWLRGRRARLQDALQVPPPPFPRSDETYIVTCPDLVVFASVVSNRGLKKLPKGAIVMTSGPARMAGGYEMLPILPRGAVQMCSAGLGQHVKRYTQGRAASKKTSEAHPLEGYQAPAAIGATTEPSPAKSEKHVAALPPKAFQIIFSDSLQWKIEIEACDNACLADKIYVWGAKLRNMEVTEGKPLEEPACSGMASAAGPTAGIARRWYVGVPMTTKRGAASLEDVLKGIDRAFTRIDALLEEGFHTVIFPIIQSGENVEDEPDTALGKAAAAKQNSVGDQCSIQRYLHEKVSALKLRASDVVKVAPETFALCARRKRKKHK